MHFIIMSNTLLQLQCTEGLFLGASDLPSKGSTVTEICLLVYQMYVSSQIQLQS